MTNTDKIRGALAQLDPARDEHWTASGLPAVPAVRALAGDDSVTRAQVEAAAPDLRRPPVGAAVELPAAAESSTAPTSPAPAAAPATTVATEVVHGLDDQGRPATAEVPSWVVRALSDAGLRDYADRALKQLRATEQRVKELERAIGADKKSPLDRAMAARRGAVRPKYPLLGGQAAAGSRK